MDAAHKADEVRRLLGLLSKLLRLRAQINNRVRELNAELRRLERGNAA
jgi:hypothetical protein